MSTSRRKQQQEQEKRARLDSELEIMRIVDSIKDYGISKEPSVTGDFETFPPRGSNVTIHYIATVTFIIIIIMCIIEKQRNPLEISPDSLPPFHPQPLIYQYHQHHHQPIRLYPCIHNKNMNPHLIPFILPRFSVFPGWILV
eukprot:TRINITY_DN661_c0_g1_i1.p1 TRINITY_DN661_c0_g1~~TRINITY_DN661_c0_g1_i1.p1  ORF type:complete len:142 (+),score=15.52 TRINITY_DN661_c0_g1_i1:63-488(+)